jgi:small-conductance mechanosensitive channel
MRFIPLRPTYGSQPPYQGLTAAEVRLVIVIVVVAAALAVLGMPVTGALALVGGALGIAAHSVRAMRASQVSLPDGV